MALEFLFSLSLSIPFHVMSCHVTSFTCEPFFLAYILQVSPHILVEIWMNGTFNAEMTHSAVHGSSQNAACLAILDKLDILIHTTVYR